MKASSRISLVLASLSGLRMLVGATSLIFLTQLKGFSVNEVSLLRGTQFIIWLVMDIPSSYLADKKSKKIILNFSILFSSLWLLITGFSNVKSFIYLGEAFNSLALTLLSGTGTAFLIENFQKENPNNSDTGEIIARQKKYSSWAMVIAIIFSSFFKLNNLNILWIFSGISMSFLLFLSFKALPKDEVTHKTSKISLRKDLEAIKEILGDKRLLLILLSYALFIGYFNNVINYNQIVTYTAFPNLNQPIFHSLIFALIMSIQAFASHTKTTKKILFFCSMMAISYLGMIFFNSKVNIVLFVLMYYFTTKLFILYSRELHNSISNNLRATIDSVVNSLGLFIASGVSFILYKNYSGITILYSIFSILLFIVTVLILTSNLKRFLPSKDTL